MAKKKSKPSKRGKSKPTTANVDNVNFDSNGKFAKGNQMRKGKENPIAARMKKLKQAILDAVSEKDLKAIMAKQIKLAKSGDTDAAKFVYDRSLGKPVQAHEVGGAGGGPIEVKIVMFGKPK